MRSDIIPGGVFPDYALPDHTGTVRTLSEIQGRDPLILTLARGHYCPKEHQQHLQLAAFYPQIAVAYTQIADPRDTVPVVWLEVNPDIEPAVSIDYRAHGAAAQRLHEVEHLTGIQSITRYGFTVDDDAQIRLSDRLFCFHVGGGIPTIADHIAEGISGIHAADQCDPIGEATTPDAPLRFPPAPRLSSTPVPVNRSRLPGEAASRPRMIVSPTTGRPGWAPQHRALLAFRFGPKGKSLPTHIRIRRTEGQGISFASGFRFSKYIYNLLVMNGC